MKKLTSLISASACAAAVLAAVPFSAGAEGSDVVYGTMNIPYADFYSAEIGGAYEVDAVSSATANKWAANNTGSLGEDGKWTNGGLVAGTYNDGNGTILGVNYPVAVSPADVSYLTENYGFVSSDSVPEAYKEVSVSGGNITVSAVKDSSPETATGSVEVTTPSNYGDVQFTVKGYPTDCDIYGVIFRTADGESYATRHLENIWRNGSFSWSVGVKTTESHGNTLNPDNFVSSQGKTITEVTYITLSGYTNITGVNAYIPVIYEGSLSIENGKAGTGSTTFTASGLPSDLAFSGSVADGFTVTADGKISYTNAAPGSYKLTVSDANGKYGNITGSFTLTTDAVPVEYKDGKLVAAKDFTDDEASNFIRNINSVTVNGTEYKTGKRGTTVIAKDGTVDFEAASGEKKVFDGSGNYTVSVAATGYEKPYEFEIKAAAQTSDTASSTTTTTTTTANGSGTTSGNDSPKTGVAGVGVPAALLTVAAGAAFVLRKKND